MVELERITFENWQSFERWLFGRWFASTIFTLPLAKWPGFQFPLTLTWVIAQGPQPQMLPPSHHLTNQLLGVKTSNSHHLIIFFDRIFLLLDSVEDISFQVGSCLDDLHLMDSTSDRPIGKCAEVSTSFGECSPWVPTNSCGVV